MMSIIWQGGCKRGGCPTQVQIVPARLKPTDVRKPMRVGFGKAILIHVACLKQQQGRQHHPTLVQRRRRALIEISPKGVSA
jgi:hypothetical protein